MSNSMKKELGSDIKTSSKNGVKNRRNIILSERSLNDSSLGSTLNDIFSQIKEIELEKESVITLKEKLEKDIAKIFLDNQRKLEEWKKLVKKPLSKKQEENKKDATMINTIPQEISFSEQELERLEKLSIDYGEEVNYLEKEYHNLNISYTILQYAKTLNHFRENSSNIELRDLNLLEGNRKKLQKIVEENNGYSRIPEELKDKFFFFRGENNTGKSSAIEALANELNRSVYTMRYNDYMNEDGLLSFFLTLTTFLKNQKEYKKQKIDILHHMEKGLRALDSEDNTRYEKFDIPFYDNEMNKIIFNLDDKEERNTLEGLLCQSIKSQKEFIDSIEDSCILSIEDLDKIIKSSTSFHEKGNLLDPIKTIIEEIKAENLDIILILQGRSLGNNNDKIKSYIDEVINFEKIETEHSLQKQFNDILKKDFEKYYINTRFPKIDFSALPREYYTIKFIDNLSKKIVKNIIIKGNDNKNQGIISKKEIDNIINEEINNQKLMKSNRGFSNNI